jgi:thiol-disulfide isomerase/thioredoxin
MISGQLNRRRLNVIKTTVVLLALAMTVTIGCSSAPKTPKNANMLNFSVSDINDRPIDMRQYLGKVVIVDIWDTWCGPCKMEIPHFVDLYSRYKGKGLEIVGLALARQGKDAVKQFTTQNGVNYTSAIYNEEAQKLFEPPAGIPTTYIIDQNGNIVEKIVGARDKAYFEGKIKSLLKIS